MWLLISIAHAVCEGPEVLDVIPLGGELRKGSWIRLQSGAEFPEAELALVEDPERIYQMTEQLAAAETPEGWVAVQIPDEVYDGDYELHLYDAGEDVGGDVFTVFAFAEIGEIGSDLYWAGTEITPTEFNPDLCSEEGDAAWHEVVVTLDTEAAPGNGWLIELADEHGPQAWIAMPEYGGEIELTYWAHWTDQETCPVARILDPFHELQSEAERGCLLLPQLLGEGDDDERRFDVACGCSGAASALGPWLLGTLLVARRRREVESSER